MVNHELWEKAIQQLDKKDQQKIRPGERQLVSLESVLLGAQKKQKECKDKQLKYRKRDGTEVELRQVFGRVVQRLVKFKAIGDSVAAIDSAHLAVPWAAISLVLQIAVSDIESYQTVFEGIESFSSLVPRYALFENLYLRAIFPLQDDLKSALVKLYAMVLQYLLRAEEYCATRTIKRIAKGLILAYSEFDGWMDEIGEQQRIADELARLIDVQVSRQADDKLDLVRSEQDALMEGLQYFHQPIQSIRDDVSDLATSWKKRERDEQEGRILSWLAPLPLVKLHRERLVPNSGRWIFEEESYIQWRVSSKSSALWLHGLPGTGKSTLVSTIIDSLQATYVHAPTGRLAYAFFSRNRPDPRWKDPGILLCCLVAQLARPGPSAPMRGDVIRAYEKMVKEEGDNAVTHGARPLWKDAIQLLFDLIDEGTTTICIDAIDECDEDLLDDFMEVIYRLLTRTDGGQVKVLISSRPSLNVAGRLSSGPLLSVEVGHNSTDLEEYARERAAKCVEKMGSPADIQQTEDELTRHLVNGAQGMFLWVKLRASVLLRRSGRSIFKGEMFQPFKDLPKALVDLFEDIYMSINKDPQESKAYQTALIIFRWLLCAQAPVPVEDLVRALDVYMAGDSIGCDAEATDLSVPMVLECCQDLIVVDKDSNEFRFVHTAVRDFLEQKDELRPQAQHAAVADLCLATVQRFAFEPMAISSLTRDIFYYYVVVYWALHVAQAGQEHGIDAINDALNDLCQELPWFKSWLPQIQPASSLVLEWNDPHKDKIIQAISSPATSFFTACAFGFNNVVHYLVQLKKDLLDKRNDLGATGLHLAAGYGHLEIAEALCRAGAEVDPIDNDGETPLIRAAAGGYEALVLMLLKAGASIRTQGRWYGTALHGAALHGHVGVVRILLDHGADIKATGGQFGTAVHAACLRGHVRVVKRLLDAGAEAEVPDRTVIKSETLEESKGGCTTAASILSVVKDVLEQERASVFGTRGYPSKPREREVTFQLLLDQDVDLNILPEGFGLPLHTAARAGHEAVVKVLLNYPGISPNSIGGEYGSALQAAALSGRTSIVEQLLNAKAYPDMQAGKYGTALIAACRQASLGVVELLLTSGASVNVQAGVYGTALHAACRSGNHLLVQRLLISGADVKLTGGEYCTALQAAARDGYEKLVQLLLQHGADVNVKGGSFGSALQAAAVGGYKRVVEMLLKADADVDDGLEFACLGGHQGVAELLLAYGSDLNHSSRAFKSPLQAALVGRHASLARWLLEKGAKAIGSSWGTSLQLAALSGDAELVGLCLKQGADPWEKACVIDEKGLQQFGVNLPICTQGSSPFPMVIAVAGGYIQIVTLLLDAQPPDASMRSDDRDNFNDELSSDFHDMYLACSPVQRSLYDALLLALETNQEEIVSLLLHHALPIDLETIEYACGMAKPSVVISLLELAEKHTPEQNNHYKNLYALSKAARNGKLELVELLLPRVVKSKKLVSGDLAEALHNAVYCESLEIVNQLLECGADPTLESDSFKQSCYAKLDFNGVTLSAAVSDGQRDTVRAMLDNKAGVDMSDYYYGTVLQRAAYTGAEDILIDLLDSGADVNAVGGFYGTAVQAAAAGGHESIVQHLICAGANLHCQGGLPGILGSREIQQDWQKYCSREDLQWWKKLTKKFNQVAETHPIRMQSGFYGTALQAAAVTGNVKIVAMLIEAGADINDIDWFGQTPLHRAAYYGHSVVVTLLLAKGADIEAIDREGRSPVLLAASMGHREIFACLLTLATEPSTSSVAQEQQLLHSASRYGHIGIIEHLMAERNIVERLDDNGQTALFIAASNGQCPTVRFLIDKGSDIHHRAHDRRTALHFAAESGHDDVARLLLKSGANMLAVDNSGQSALHYAASNGHNKVVYLLMEQGAPPNLQNYSGMTPLHLAVRSESSETIVFLLDKGANVNAKANNGDTPLEFLPRSEAHLRSLLIRRGATDFSDGEEPSEVTRSSASASDVVSNRHRWNTYRRRWSSPVGSRRWHRRRDRSESTGMESKDAICSSEMGSISERPSLLPENRVEIDRDNVADDERKDDKKDEDVADKQNPNHMTRMTGEVYMFMITIMTMMVVVLLALMMVTVVAITIVMWTMLSIMMMRWAMKILS